MTNIIMLPDYNPETHVNFVKFAQINERDFPLGKRHKVAHWVAYADEMPNFPGTELVNVTGNDDVQEGWFYDDVSGTFQSMADGLRGLYSSSEHLVFVREARNYKLLMCDRLVIRHRDQIDGNLTPTLTAQQYQELLTYRQALRDFPEVCADPINPIWPTKPSFV